MYSVRAVIAILSVFTIAYVALSFVVAIGWRVVKLLPMQWSTSAARFLYVLRIAPLVGAAAVALGFELPSFLYFEPKHVDEVLNGAPLLLSVVALSFIGVGVWRSVVAYIQTSKLCRSWTDGAVCPEFTGFEVSRSAENGPSIAVVGIGSPRLLLSPKVSSVLNREELKTALAHESAHVENHDNLRKLLLQLCRFPGMTALERSWEEAVEFAADERAVTSRREALALASALVKVSGLQLGRFDSHLPVTNFVGDPGSTARRVLRLIEWREPSREKTLGRWVAISSVGMAAIAAIGCYGAVLTYLHLLTEALFR